MLPRLFRFPLDQEKLEDLNHYESGYLNPEGPTTFPNLDPLGFPVWEGQKASGARPNRRVLSPPFLFFLFEPSLRHVGSFRKTAAWSLLPKQYCWPLPPLSIPDLL